MNTNDLIGEAKDLLKDAAEHATEALKFAKGHDKSGGRRCIVLAMHRLRIANENLKAASRELKEDADAEKPGGNLFESKDRKAEKA